MKNAFDYRMEIRMSSDMWAGLGILSGQFGYSDRSHLVRAIFDTMIYGATTEEQERIDIALLPFVKQSYKPTPQMKADFFDFLSQDEYLMLTARIDAKDFFADIIDVDKHPEESKFVQDFVAKYHYMILPRDMRFLLNLYYNDPITKANMQEKYAELVRYRARERMEAIADAR